MTQKFTLRQLEYFCAVADAGSFSGAAGNLFISSSAVASAITDLESGLGAQLFVRRKAQGINLTPAGMHLLKQARELLRQAAEVQLSMADESSELAGPLVLGSFSTLAATVLPSLIDGFSREHPRVDISFSAASMPELEPLLESGQLDILITYRINLPSGLEEAVLYETEVHVLLSADHPLADADSVDLNDLADEPLIMLDIPPSGRHTLDLLQAAGIQPTVRHRTDNFELVRSLVARGQGYSLLVQKPSIDHSYEGLPLVAKRISPQSHHEVAVIVWPTGVTLSARAIAFIRYAQLTVGEHVWSPTAQPGSH